MPKKHVPDTRRCQLEKRARTDSRRLGKTSEECLDLPHSSSRIQSDFTISSLLRRRLSSSLEVIRRDQPSVRALAQPFDSHSRGLV
jgi:hypothetical protein